MNESKAKFITDVAVYIHMHITNVSIDVCYFIACQFALESNFGNSHLAKYHHNYCGMKFPKRRPRLATKIEGSKFAHYLSLPYCIIDYFFCLAFHGIQTSDFESIEKFSDSLSNWYCPEGDYIHKINLIYKNYQNFKDEQNK